MMRLPWRRIGAALGLAFLCIFIGNAASWAAPGDPAPMPSPYGVAEVWRCADVAPDPYVTPTPAPDPPEPSPTSSETRCWVSSWATPAPVPTVTSTETVTATPTPEPSSTEPPAPTEVVLTDTQFSPLLLTAGVVVLLGSAAFLLAHSAPPTFGIKR